MTLFLNLFIVTPQNAHNGETQHFKGQIVSVQKYNLVTKPAPYVQFILDVKGEEFTVDVGPEWYVHAQGILLVPREDIEVVGFLQEEIDPKLVLAQRLKQGASTLKLRDESGKPLWELE
jgi:hypothetical protein